MKIYDYPSATEVQDTDVLLIDGGGTTEDGLGTRKIKTDDAVLSALDEFTEEPWVIHRNIYRGKNLGSKVTEEQIAHIHDGSFRDLYVGDYWEIDDVVYRIADINYFLHQGVHLTMDDKVTSNHLVIVPDSNDKYLSQWNTTGTTSTGYAGSYIRNTGMSSFKNAIHLAFPNMIIPHCVSISNSASLDSNKQLNIGMINDTSAEIELMWSSMVYGDNEISNTLPKTNAVAIERAYSTQFALFRLNPNLISPIFDRFWFLDIYNDGNVIVSNYYAAPSTFGVTGNMFIRPYFLIG